MRDFSHDESLTPAAFALVLREVFSGEPWAEIEPYAERAWSQLPAAQRWEEIRESVLQHFEGQAA
jgi:hypothetical protein